MPRKITFEKKYGIVSSDRKWLGLKVMTVSFLITMFGVLLAFSGFIEFAQLFVILGIAGSFVGMAIHFAAMFRQFRESRK